MKRPANYRKMWNMLGKQIQPDLSNWTTLWGEHEGGLRENFFVNYAIEGCPCKNSINKAEPPGFNLCNSQLSESTYSPGGCGVL